MGRQTSDFDEQLRFRPGLLRRSWGPGVGQTCVEWDRFGAGFGQSRPGMTADKLSAPNILRNYPTIVAPTPTFDIQKTSPFDILQKTTPETLNVESMPHAPNETRSRWMARNDFRNAPGPLSE